MMIVPAAAIRRQIMERAAHALIQSVREDIQGTL